MTEAELRASKWSLVAHIDLTRRGVLNVWGCDAIREVTMHHYWKNPRTSMVRTFHYLDNEVDTLGDIVHLLNGEDDVVALKEDMRAISKLMTQASGKFNLMTESGRLNPAELEVAFAAVEQVLAMMPPFRAKVQAYVAANAKPAEPKKEAI